MNTEQQTTEVKPKQVRSRLDNALRDETEGDRLLELQHQQQQARIAENPDAYLPNLSELRETDRTIREQQEHWSEVFTTVSRLVEKWEAGQRESQDVVTENQSITDRPLRTSEKQLLAAAQERLSRFAWRLKRDSNRLLTAKLNVKVWDERAKEFNKNDRPRMIRLEREEKRTNRILQSVTG